MARVHRKRTPRSRHHKKWAYKNTVLIVLSVIVFLLIADTDIVRWALMHMSSYGYVSAAFAGMLFVSTFTIAPGTAILFHLAEELDPYLIALYAGMGAVIGDLLIYRFFKGSIFKELTPLFNKFGGSHLTTLLHSPHFGWFTPVLGAMIIAVPILPDELGIGLMGLSKVKEWQFILLTYTLNVLGVLVIVLAAQAL